MSDGVTESVTLSVIIPTYNARELLANCLRSIYQNSPSEPYEVIVVDDASADGTNEMVRAHFPEVRQDRISALPCGERRACAPAGNTQSASYRAAPH